VKYNDEITFEQVTYNIEYFGSKNVLYAKLCNEFYKLDIIEGNRYYKHHGDMSDAMWKTMYYYAQNI